MVGMRDLFVRVHTDDPSEAVQTLTLCFEVVF
jgi:hypothetical protein